MAGEEGVHESLEIRSPPLRERVANLPVIVDAFPGKLRPDRREALVQPRLETLDLVVFVAEVVTWASWVSAVAGAVAQLLLYI